MASLMDDVPLSKEEQEEEEMRQELKDVGLYYENMDVEEMRQLINVVNESKNDSRNPNEDSLDDSILFSENRSTENTSKVTENITKRPIPSFSYKQAVLSGTIITQDSGLEEFQNSIDQNSQASSSNSYEKNYTTNSPDSESIFDRNSNFKKDEDYPTLANNRYKTRSTTADTRTRSQESKKLSLPASKRTTLERWSLDPLEFVKDKNTTLLCQPQHSKSHLEESLPYCSEAIDLDSEEFDQLCQQMDEKLGTFNKQCLLELGTREKLAAPIKINHEADTANKLPAKEKPLSINTQGPNTSNRNSYDRATKRKALSTIAAATDFFENDENSSDEFSNTKKRKCQQGKKEEETAKKCQENQKNKNVDKSIETISIDDSKDSLDLFDNSELHNIRKNSNKNVSNDNGSDEAQSRYPRRITPPIPGKKNYKGPRAKKNNSTLIQSKADSEKKKVFLNDDEINKTLQEIDEQIEDTDCVEITDDIKPSPLPKHVSKRLSIAANRLGNARESEEQKSKAEEEANERRKKEERLKMDELISSRLQEQENEESRRQEKQRKCNEQTAFYNNILDTKSRVTRSSFQQKKTDEEIAEDILLDGDDDEPTVTKVIQKQMCPICQKPYPADQIQSHASGCHAYAIDSNEAYNEPSTSRYNESYKCHLCDIYQTNDGNLYEEHVTSCKNRPRNLMNGGWMSK